MLGLHVLGLLEPLGGGGVGRREGFGGAHVAGVFQRLGDRLHDIDDGLVAGL